jgi:hypothetical protein
MSVSSSSVVLESQDPRATAGCWNFFGCMACCASDSEAPLMGQLVETIYSYEELLEVEIEIEMDARTTLYTPYSLGRN